MKKMFLKNLITVFLVMFVIFIIGCEPTQEPVDKIDEASKITGPIVDDGDEQIIEESTEPKHEGSNDEFTQQDKQFRIEIPALSERETLPTCDNLQFTTYPVDMNQVSAITPLGNIGPPGHTLPTQHPHLHMGERGSGKPFDIFAPSDVYLTAVAWSNNIGQDPRDYTIYFALCEGVVGYYNHVKSVSPELQTILDNYGCESFGDGNSESCTKVLDLEKFEEGNLMGTVGLKQGNWDFGLIDLRKPLDFIKPLRHPERDRYLQCAFDYYPKEMKDKFYSLLLNDDGTCGEVMQDIPGTLKGDWYHETAQDEYVVDWDVFLAFINDWQFSEAQVVSIAGKFTNPSKFEFIPKNHGTINRDFADVTNDGKVYCYHGEDIGRSFEKIASGKVIVQMTDDQTLKIEHKTGTCTGSESLTNPQVYKR